MIILMEQITNKLNIIIKKSLIKAYNKRIRGIGNYKNNKRVIG